MSATTTLRTFWRDLAEAPEPLTQRQRAAALIATLATAITRWLAISRTPWDWDEMLFALAQRRYNVALHHPHPPGFPLYIGTANLLRLFGVSDFHALQTISFIGAVTIVPAMVMLCRELRMRVSTSLIAALLLALFPNVWFYGGTAFSDVPSMTLVIVAMALLLRGCRDNRAYIAGAIVLAIAGGYRPQNLVIGAAPMLIATAYQFCHGWKRPLAAALLLIIIVAGGYASAAALTGWQTYREALRWHADYIAKIDSFRAPTRPALWRLFDDFFMRPYDAPAINYTISALVIVSLLATLVRLRPHVLVALAAFAPFCLFAWLMLDRFSVSRFSIGYAPLIALLAADGLQVISRRPAIEWPLGGAVAALMMVWTWPAIREVHTHASPPIAALQWIRANVRPGEGVIFVDGGMVPFGEEYLNGYRTESLSDREPPVNATGYYLREDASNAPEAHNFVRPHGRLWKLARRRYFEVSVTPLSDVVHYGRGWYEEEGNGASVWRWMSKRGVAALPPINGSALLTLSFYVPLDVLRVPPTIEVRLNGAVIDRFAASRPNLTRTATVPARGDQANELVIETDRTVTPAALHAGGDRRNLGLRLNALGWRAAP